MILGGAIPAIAFVLGASVEPRIDMLIIGGALGTPLGIVCGSAYGIEAREADQREAFDLALRMAVVAVLAGDLIIGALVTIGLATGGLYWLVMGVVATVGGLIVLGLPALAFTIACTLVWISVLRALPSRLVGDAPPATA